MTKAPSNRRWWAAFLVAALLALPAAPASAVDRDRDGGVVNGLTDWLHGALAGLPVPFGGLFAVTAAETTCEPDQCVDVDGTCCECSSDGETCEDTSGGLDDGGNGGFIDPNG